MTLEWRTWCGLCGALPRVPFLDLREENELLEVAIRCFSISLEKNGPTSVCPSCESVLKGIWQFNENCRGAREMLNELKKRKTLNSEEEMLEFRKIYMDESQPVEEEVQYNLKEETPIKDDTAEEIAEPLVMLSSDDQMEEVTEEEVEETIIEEGDYEEEDIHSQVDEENEETWPLVDVIGTTQLRKGRRSKREEKALTKKIPKSEPRPPVQCSECHEEFRLKKELNAHIHEKHPGLRKFVCEECGKTFPTTNQLNSHKVSHVNEPQHKCPQCPKSFKNRRRMLVHLEVHSAEKYICPECGLQLNTRFTYQRHMHVHSDVKSFKCDICSKTFKRQKTLKDHLIIHSGLRPYKCPFCERTFVNGPNCRSHKLKAHPVELAALEASDMNETVMENCRNIPSIQELIAVSLQRLSGGGSQDMDTAGQMVKAEYG